MTAIKRTYLLGEEWLYYKIYCGVRTTDALLAKEIAHLTEELITEGLINKWFFIRYSDPHNHIRLRLKLTNNLRISEVINRFNAEIKELVDHKLIWKVQTENYSREVERYGANTMELSESIFFHQSQLITKLLQEELDEEEYFMAICDFSNQFIEQFGLKNEVKSNFLHENVIAYQREFKLDKRGRNDINSKIKKLKVKYSTRETNFTSFYPMNLLKSSEGVIEQIKKLSKEKCLEVPLLDLLTSHIHMFVNRSFREKQRLYEMILYFFLNKTVMHTSQF